MMSNKILLLKGVKSIIFSILTVFTVSTIYYYHKQTKKIVKPEIKKEYLQINYPSEDVPDKRRLLLAVGILSKLSALSRRMAIRTTWFNVCKDNVEKVDCTFFTDVPKVTQANLTKEEEYNDIVYMPYHGK